VRHPLRWIVAAVVVVVLAVGGLAAWWILGDDAPPAPELSDAPDPGGAPPATGEWEVVAGDDVYVGYRIKELFGGATIKRDAVGRTGDVRGSLVIEDDRVRRAEITADVTTLDSGRAARDSYLRTNALQTEEFPEATFVLAAPIDFGREGPRAVAVRARGRLTLHGETRSIVVDVEAQFDGETIEVAGTAPVVLADFGIEAPDTPVAAVDDNGSLELHLRFERAP
jgi:polyisoprenoid-binding protein YceI